MKIERENNKAPGSKTSLKGPGSNFSELLSQKQSVAAPGPQSFEAPSSVIGQKGFGPKPAFLEKKSENSVINPKYKNPAPPSKNKGYVANVMTGFTQSTGAILPKRAESYMPLILKYSRLYGIDPHLVAGMIKQESGFNPNARSHMGAMGLMQLMPQTARSLGVTNPFDPEQSIAGGTRYLRQMIDKFGGNLTLAVAAYNAGPGNVAKHGYKVPPFTETQNYVKAIVGHIRSFKMSGIFS